MMSFQYFVILVVTTFLVRDVVGDEPQCSKFDFEEKLLEKVVRMEFQMDKLKSEMALAVEKILSTRSTVESTLQDLDSERDKLASDITAKMSSLQQQIETELGKKINEINSVTDRVLGTKLLFRVVQRKSNFYVNTGDIIVLSEVLHNEGAYEPWTGVFTATVNGTYVFTVRLCPHNEQYVKPAVMVDGKEQDVFTFYSKDGVHCSSAETLLSLKEDQKVWLQVKYADSSASIYSDPTRWNTFSGRVL